MNDSVFVRGRQTFRKLYSQIDHFLFWQWATGYFCTHRDSGDIFHHQEIHARLRVEVMNRRDVGMVQPGENQGLFVEALAGRLVRQRPRR